MTRGLLLRYETGVYGTFGILSIGNYRWHMLELPWRGNCPRRSCIPDGERLVEIVQSPRFGPVYEVKEVPERSHILVHGANFAGDTTQPGLVSHLLGCLAPGLKRGMMRNAHGVMQPGVILSRPALTEIMRVLGGAAWILDIRWACEPGEGA